jgi:hypothetical protein
MTHGVDGLPLDVGDKWPPQAFDNDEFFAVAMVQPPKILIEVMYKADYCLPCFYMDETVQHILPKYEKYIQYRRVDFMKGADKQRFLDLSYSLFGQENVRKYGRVAPVPSLFINGELVFDAIPPLFDLEEAIEEAIREKGLKS